jgi:hypothetical protein
MSVEEFTGENAEREILMALLHICYPDLKERTSEQLAFIHSVLDRIIKLNKGDCIRVN